jgi:GNAT superfamily N-acetyltransferase
MFTCPVVLQYNKKRGAAMSMWADYIKETLDKEMLELEEGFVTFFKVPGTTVCYIEDIYTRPEFRRQNITKKLEDLVIKWAKFNGCTQLMGSVSLNRRGTERSVQGLISSGYIISDLADKMIYLKKNI